jgi:hypothetical protein
VVKRDSIKVPHWMMAGMNPPKDRGKHGNRAKKKLAKMEARRALEKSREKVA